MNKQSRSQLALGLILILAGAWFFAKETIPVVAEFADQFFQWPYTLVWIGALILVIGLLTGNPGMSVPAMIVAGIGGIFYYIEEFGSYSDWSFLWALIPGFVGVGSILAGILGDNPRQNISRGFGLLLFSAAIFLVFATWLGDIALIGEYGPAIVLIGLGLWLLGRSLWKSFTNRGGQNA